MRACVHACMCAYVRPDLSEDSISVYTKRGKKKRKDMSKDDELVSSVGRVLAR